MWMHGYAEQGPVTAWMFKCRMISINKMNKSIAILLKRDIIPISLQNGVVSCEQISGMRNRKIIGIIALLFCTDLLLSNPEIIKPYHYASNFLGIKKQRSDDWILRVKDGIVCEETVGGEGDDIYQIVGFSYWDEEAGRQLSWDIQDGYRSPSGIERYWEQVPLVYRKDHYQVEIRECREEDVVEIDTFNELKTIDRTYDV